jgi:hypothetical protein
MNVERAWIALPKPPERVRVYARRVRDGHLDVALKLRPKGTEWEFVGWLANDMLLADFRIACNHALTDAERKVTAALNEGPDTPFMLSVSTGAGGSRVYSVIRSMLARRKVSETAMFEGRESANQRAKPLRVLMLAEAS